MTALPTELRAVVLAAALALTLAGAAPAAAAKKFEVIVFGDSYGSGEGAPAVNGDYGSDGGRLRGDGAIGQLGETYDDRAFPNPSADWNGDATDQAFTGDGPLKARRCHRSPRATSAQAVRSLATEFPGVEFTFRSFACSGARIDEGVLGDYEGAQPIDQQDRVQSQLSAANEYIERTGEDRNIDALVMNIGGNNLGFGNVIQRCLNLPTYQGLEPCSPANVSQNGIGNDDTLRVIQTGEGSNEPVDAIGLDDLPGWYAELNRRITRASGETGTLLRDAPAKIYLTTPPNPAGGTLGGCLTGFYDYEKSLRSDEHAWLRDFVFPTLVDAMSTAAATHGWAPVHLGPAAPANGMCNPSNRMFNRNRDSLRAQGATVVSSAGLGVSHGLGHPNAAGYTATAPILATALRPQVIASFTPGSPAANTTVPAPVVALGNRVQLRLPDPPEDYNTLPAGSTQFGDTRTGAPGLGIGTVDVPVPITEDKMALLARRCGPLGPSLIPPAGCSTARTVFDVLTGTPGVPTNVTAGALGGVRVAWTKGSPAARTLRRFLVTAKSTIETTAIMESFTTTREFTVSPDLRSTVLPLEAGDWRITVQECTDRGCNSPSPQITARSSGVAQISESDLAGLTELQTISPVGIFSMAAGRAARRGKTLPLQVSWGVWRQWKSLRELRLRMVGERGELGTIILNMRSRRVTVDGPDSGPRRGRLGRRGNLKAKRFTLKTRKARIVGSGPRGRLVAVELPLTLSKRLKRQRVDVEAAASASDGKTQGFGPAGSFQVR